MTLGLRYAARTDVGLAREGNEDALYAGPRLLAVADGMGGHAAGEVASRIVIETLAPLDTDSPDGDGTEALRRAVTTANGYLRDMVAADGALEGMGTTLTAMLWVAGRLALIHIGDSRAYLLRDGHLDQITHDHTFVQSLIDEGRITPEEATTHPQRSWITNALDGRRDVEPDVSLRDVRVGDRYLVCSDGLSSYVSEETIAATLSGDDPQAACDQFVELALRAGGLDNISCIVAEVVDEGPAAEEPIVAGAAAGEDPPPARRDSPAARAAAIQPQPPGPTLPLEEDDGDEDAAAPARSSHRLAFVIAAVVLVVLAGAVATFLYIRTLYYVGVASGATPTVGVYRGVQGNVLGLDLSRLTTRTDLPVDALPADDRDRVTEGIQANGRTDAARIIATLRSNACQIATPSPAPTAAPSASPSPRPTPRPSASPSRHHRHKAAQPKPTPPPLPSYCTGQQ